MLQCDGYKMFKGTATVTPANGKPPFQVSGTWLYRPDVKYWYCKPDHIGFAPGFPPEILSDMKEDE